MFAVHKNVPPSWCIQMSRKTYCSTFFCICQVYNAFVLFDGCIIHNNIHERRAMRKNKLTEYGVKIKLRLIERNQTQEWLINEVNKRDIVKLDSSFLNKIMTGTIKTSLAVPIIDEILGIDFDEDMR